MTIADTQRAILTWAQEQPERVPCPVLERVPAPNGFALVHVNWEPYQPCWKCGSTAYNTGTVPNVLPSLVQDAVSVVQDMRSMGSPFPVPERVLREIATVACDYHEEIEGFEVRCLNGTLSMSGQAHLPHDACGGTGRILDESVKWAYLGRFIPVLVALGAAALPQRLMHFDHTMMLLHGDVDGVLTAVLEAVNARR